MESAAANELEARSSVSCDFLHLENWTNLSNLKKWNRLPSDNCVIQNHSVDVLHHLKKRT